MVDLYGFIFGFMYIFEYLIRVSPVSHQEKGGFIHNTNIHQHKLV